MEASEYFDCVTGDGLHTETILVTPTVAAAWLERNVTNRAISPKHVTSLAWDITKGLWVLTHQGIAFNTRRFLVDGQHRLSAVMEANKAALMRVTFNVDTNYNAPIDVGRIRRVHDVIDLTAREVAICNALLTLESRSYGRGTTARVESTYDVYEKSIEWAIKTFPNRRSFTVNIMAAHVYAHTVRPKQVERFARELLAPHDEAAEGSPALALSKYLERTRSASLERLGLTLATLRCLHAHCAGQPLTRVPVNEVGFEYFSELRAAKAG